jgi:chromosome segregation ATPase
LKITRKQTNGVSNFFRNEEKTQKEEIHKELKKYGIDLFFPERFPKFISSRFIILQHNTIKIGTKSPLDLVDHLEQLIGTNHFKKEIEKEKYKLNESLQEKNKKIEELSSIEIERTKLEPDLKKFNEYLSKSEEFKLERDSYHGKLKSLNLFEYKESRVKLLEIENNLKSKESSIQEIEEFISKLTIENVEKEKSLEKVSEEKKSFEEKLSGSSKEIELKKVLYFQILT